DDVENTVATAAIVPGGNKATLTLADGQVINLSETQNGIVLGEELTYIDGSGVLGAAFRDQRSAATQGDPRSRKPKGLPLMSLTTPDGGTYQVTLSDGTKVWLSSAGMLRYPPTFDGVQREVELEGEAFLDVAPKKTPFCVKSRDQVVQVLGPQFNVTSYPDEAEIKTTLVEGMVQVIN